MPIINLASFIYIYIYIYTHITLIHYTGIGSHFNLAIGMNCVFS